MSQTSEGEEKPSDKNLENAKGDFTLEDVTVEFVTEKFENKSQENPGGSSKKLLHKRPILGVGTGYQHNTRTFFTTDVREPEKEQLNEWRQMLQSNGQVLCPFPACQISYCSLRGLILHYQSCTGTRDEVEAVKCKICRHYVSCRISLAHHNRLLHRGKPMKSVSTFMESRHQLNPKKVALEDNSVKTTKSMRQVRKPVRYRDIEIQDDEMTKLNNESDEDQSSDIFRISRTRSGLAISSSATDLGNSGHQTEETLKSTFLQKMGLKRKNEAGIEMSPTNDLLDEDELDKGKYQQENSLRVSERMNSRQAYNDEFKKSSEMTGKIMSGDDKLHPEERPIRKRGRPKKKKNLDNDNLQKSANNKESEMVYEDSQNVEENLEDFDSFESNSSFFKNNTAITRITCGVCLKEFTNAALFQQHVLLSHNGLARSAENDQNFTEEEKKEILRQTFKKLGKLLCPLEGCRKPLISLPGYLYHVKNCNKDVKVRIPDECDDLLLDKKQKKILQHTIKQCGKLICPKPTCKKSLLTITGYINHIKNCRRETESEKEDAAKEEELRKPVNCGKCNGNFASSDQFRQHSISQHNGLARPTGENQEFTEEEKQQALRNAFKVLKKLRCQNPGCGKSFISIGGYVYHEKQCGQEGIYNDCPICGKRLKEFSVKYHMKMAHPPSPPPAASQEDLCVKLELKEQPKRKAAKRAREKVLEIARGFDRDDMHPLNDKNTSNTTNNLESENTERPVLSYTRPPLIHISTSLYAEWREQLEKSGKIMCKHQGCNETFAAPWLMRNHYISCPNNPLSKGYTCNQCGRKTKTESAMLQHIDSHKLGWNNNGSDEDYESDFEGEGRNPSLQTAYAKFNNPFSWNATEMEPFPMAVDWTYEFIKKHYQEALYLKWRPLEKDWIPLPKEKHKFYLPATTKSISFKTSNVPNMDTTYSWKTANLFESSSTNEEDGDSATFFVGGPVWACAWCPTPVNRCGGQFLAISNHLQMDTKSKFIDVFNGPGLIQIWEISETKQPKYSLSAKFCYGIAHNCGYIWELEWCPSGCWDESNQIKEGILPRLGLLAAACSNGNICIFSVAQPSSIGMTTNENPLIFKVDPTLVLDTGAILSSGETSRLSVQCLCLSWLRSKGHRLIAGGFADGHIAFWDLETKSPLLHTSSATKTTFSPYLIHRAHSSSVHSIAWSPSHNGQFLATAGMDRQLYIWSSNDLSLQFNSSSRGRILKVRWMSHWCGVFSSQDDCYNLGRNATGFMESGYFGYCHRALIGHNGCIWDIAINDWMNCCITCDSSGEVVGSILCQLLQNLSNIKHLSKRRFPIYRCILTELHPKTAEDDDNRTNLIQDNSLADENDEAHHLNKNHSCEIDCAIVEQNSENISDNKKDEDTPMLQENEEDDKTSKRSSPSLEAVFIDTGECNNNLPNTDEKEIVNNVKIILTDEHDKSSKTTEKNSMNSSMKSKVPSAYIIKPRTYEEITSKCGIHFLDTNMASKKTKKEEYDRLMNQSSMIQTYPDMYPITSVNKLAWNPNIGYQLILASGCQSGLVRIHRIHWLNRPNIDRLQGKLQTSARKNPEMESPLSSKNLDLNVQEVPDNIVETQMLSGNGENATNEPEPINNLIDSTYHALNRHMFSNEILPLDER